LVDESHEKLRRYVNIFNDMGEDWEAIVDVRDTARETDFIQSVMSKKGTILDLCCGTGRHSLILRKLGWNPIGLDLSKNLLSIAKRNMKREGRDFPLVRADMRSFPFRTHVFDASISMFTSFGYLPSENEDLKSFKEVQRTLRKGGQFILDVANREHLIKVFQEREWAEFEPFYMLEKRSLNQQASRLMSQWTIIRKDTRETRSLQHNVRLYTLQSLKQMLSQAGLEIKEIYGGYDRKAFNSDSSRMIMLTESTTEKKRRG
jgi:SAM-dependent methyltransferase